MLSDHLRWNVFLWGINPIAFYRKTLYQRVFEYDTPLFHTGICKYEFITIEESEYDNPWKESFKQLHHGVHVRPGFQEKALKHPSRYKGLPSDRNLLKESAWIQSF